MTESIVTQDGTYLELFGDRDMRPDDDLEHELRQLFAEELMLEETRRKMADELKLAKQHAYQPIERKIERLKIGSRYQELTGETLEIWRRFLPTRYADSGNDNKRWGDYSFDAIPVEVLAEMKLARDLGCFTRLEIWTPEKPQPKRHTDPMLVGVLEQDEQTHYFAVARWGEALLPFDKIRKLVKPRRWMRLLKVSLMTVPIMSYFVLMASIVGRVLVDHGESWAVLAAAGLTLGTLIIWGGLELAWVLIDDELGLATENISLYSRGVRFLARHASLRAKRAIKDVL